MRVVGISNEAEIDDSGSSSSSSDSSSGWDDWEPGDVGTTETESFADSSGSSSSSSSGSSSGWDDWEPGDVGTTETESFVDDSPYTGNPGGPSGDRHTGGNPFEGTGLDDIPGWGDFEDQVRNRLGELEDQTDMFGDHLGGFAAGVDERIDGLTSSVTDVNDRVLGLASGFEGFQDRLVGGVAEQIQGGLNAMANLASPGGDGGPEDESGGLNMRTIGFAGAAVAVAYYVTQEVR